MQYASKLIVIRGNSGSGKGAAANAIRENSQRNIAIVGQDTIRRNILNEKEREDGDNIDLIYTTVEFSLSRNYDVILEGILNFSRYGKMLQKLERICPDNHFYYLDVSFEETLRRHVSKSNAHEFGEEAMRRWFKDKDVTGFKSEMIIPESSSLLATTKFIMNSSGIKK